MKKHKNIKKTLKFAILIPVLSIIALTFAVFSSFFIITHKEKLSEDNLTKAYSSSINLISSSGNKMQNLTSSRESVNLENLHQYTKDAFVSMEDKNFYTHNGVNIKRMAGALVANIKNGKIVQGASTISQQLIKNTHLSSEKSITRKLKEIKLTLDLEKNYTKNEILTMYLSNIYFGSGNYGLEAASKCYFNKEAKNLSLSESAMLAGIISAPSTYNPLANINLANNRKNLVLAEMLKDEKISKLDYEKAILDTPQIYGINTQALNQYINACLNEACQILHLNENQLSNKDYNIYTYFNEDLNNEISNIITNNTHNLKDVSAASIVADKNGNVLAFSGNTNIDMYNSRRQPGSAIKPIIVYAPAIEYDHISPETTIIDEPINYEGYSPENANNKYNGTVSVRDALKKSLNIPAVKILNTTGIEKSKKIASKMGIKFSKFDQNLSLALGGFTDGTSMIELLESYLTLQNNGSNIEPKFIQKITDASGNTLYERINNKKQVIRESTATLLTDMLCEVSKSGTAARLSSLPFQIASKTGTVGVADSNENTDAWNASYTTEHVFITWLGANQNTKMSSSINGSTYPTNITKNITEYIYKNNKPTNFNLSNDTLDIKFNNDNNQNTNANGYYDLFLQNSFSKNHNKKPAKPTIIINNFINNKPELRFFAQSGFVYSIYKNNEFLDTIVGNDSEISYTDNQAQQGEIYCYHVSINTNTYNISSNKVKVICLK